MAHKSADVNVLATALSRGAFEYQGQKCSACSRAYIPSNLWDETKKLVLADLKSMKMGGTEDFTNFINAAKRTGRDLHIRARERAGRFRGLGEVPRNRGGRQWQLRVALQARSSKPLKSVSPVASAPSNA